MKIKHTISGIFVLILIASLTFSCNDYLEMPAQTGFNKDSVFANYRNTSVYLYNMYQHVPKIVLNWTDGEILCGPSRVTLTDEGAAISLNSNYNSLKVYAGAVNSTWFTSVSPSPYTHTGEDIYDRHWVSIRKCFIMLENIDKVPDATPEIKGRIKGECQTLIALEYFEMWKRYGGIPIVKQSLSGDFQFIPRQPLGDVYNYIIELCDQAINNPNFPATVPNPLEFGRATKALAYGLKARTMLYAASPLFNSATPYMDFGVNNNLICFNNYDQNRWKLARDAALDAIQYCENNGYAIVNTAGINKNYTVACCKRPKDGNTEIIFGTMDGTPPNIGSAYTLWSFRGRQYGYATNSPTQNAVEFYQNMDGSKVNWDVKITTSPDKPEEPYANLEPRFQQSIAYNGCVWYTNPTMIPQFYDPGETGVAPGLEGTANSKTEYNFGFRKYLNDYEKSDAGFIPMNPIMRLAEMYLISAEASNELEGPTAKTFDLLDAIRTRSGMPTVDRSLNQEGLRSFIVNERAVELYAEDHRYFDLKRWKTPGPFQKIYNVKVLKYLDNTYTYEKYLNQTRIWFNFWYLHPFPDAEINKGYGLIQNPGW